MEDRLLLHRQCQERRQEYKDLAAKSCYSVIIVMIALAVLRPLMVDQILSRAGAYCAVGLLDESQRQCDKALLIDENSSQAWRQLAQIHRTKGDREMAYGAYGKAVQADGANRAAHFELGMMYVDDGRYPLAIPHLEHVRRSGLERTKTRPAGPDSYHRAALHMLVLCYEKVGDPVKTQMTLEEIRVFYPEYKSGTKLPDLFTQNQPAR